MLNWLRKYQKIIFIFTTVMIICSFSFFGVMRVGAGSMSSSKQESKVLGTAIDGSPIMSNEIRQMVRFLSQDVFDARGKEHAQFPNYFNDGVIRKNIIETGIALELAKTYYETFRKTFEEKFDRFKNYEPYEHPQAPFICTKNVWQQFMPQMAMHFQQYQKVKDKKNITTLDALFHLYLDQSVFPATYLRHILSFQQGQYNWIKKDPYIEQGDLHLFKVRNFSDWFGSEFMDAVCQFIHNSAIYAQESGHQISDAEVKANLYQIGYENLRHEIKQSDINTEDIALYFNQALRAYGLEEKQALDIWKKVMLFRRLLTDASNTLLLDPMLYQDITTFSKESLDIDLYQMSQEFHLSTLEDLFKFELYAKLVGNKRKFAKTTQMPSIFAHPDELKATMPDLVMKTFDAEITEVSMEELMQSVSVKQMWQMQQSDEHYKELCKISSLATHVSKEKRLEAIEALSNSERAKIDRFTKEQIVLQNPEWIVNALKGKESLSKTINVTYAGSCFELKDCEKDQQLVDLLELSDVSNPAEIDCINAQNHKFYALSIHKVSEPQIITFEMALNSKFFRDAFEHELQALYEKVKKIDTNRLHFDNNTTMSVDEAKDTLIKFALEPLMQAIKRDYVAIHNKNLPTSLGDDFYAKHRFLAFLTKAKEELCENLTNEKLLQGDHKDVNNQFLLFRKAMTIHRSNYSDLFDDNIFRMKQSEWSFIDSLQSGQLAFYYVNQRSLASEDLLKTMEKGRDLLSEEVQCHVMLDLISQMKAKNAIHFEKDVDGV